MAINEAGEECVLHDKESRVFAMGNHWGKVP